MTMSAPPATGVRIPWGAVPESVRHAVADLLGGPVVEAVTQTGGFSPGPAVRVRTADGRRGFVKAVSSEANPDSPDMHRREARNAAALPAGTPAPRLLGMHDDGNWVALVFEDIDGRQPRVPWDKGELARVLDAVGELSRTLTPSPVDVPPVGESLAGAFRGWQQMSDTGHGAGDRSEGLDPWTVRNLPALAELAEPWAEFASGDTLAHGDLRADNILLTAPENASHRVLFVDWPHAQLAAPWFDLLVMLPCVRAQGGPDPEVLFTEHPLGRAADPGRGDGNLGRACGILRRTVAAALATRPADAPRVPAGPGRRSPRMALRKRLGSGPS